MEGINDELWKIKYQVLSCWVCGYWKRSDVLCLLLCGGRIPHFTTLFFFLETPEFNCALYFIVGDANLVVEHRGWITEMMTGYRDVVSSPYGWVWDWCLSIVFQFCVCACDVWEKEYPYFWELWGWSCGFEIQHCENLWDFRSLFHPSNNSQ